SAPVVESGRSGFVFEHPTRAMPPRIRAIADFIVHTPFVRGAVHKIERGLFRGTCLKRNLDLHQPAFDNASGPWTPMWRLGRGVRVRRAHVAATERVTESLT